MQPLNMNFGTLPKILCCVCGLLIESNPSNMCINCLRSQVDISEGIPKQLTVPFCRTCGSYLQPPNNWVQCSLESKELLTILIKKVRGLSKVKLIDAGFVWTEPHSKRLKIKLTIQKEVFTATMVQQSFIVEFIVQNLQCTNCTKSQTNEVNTWTAVAQVRQKVDHKRTFFYLEQLILKHSAHLQTINIKEQPDGLDFYFSHRSHALRFVDFLQAVVPIRFKTSERLISQDDNSNTYNHKYTFSVEIAPICKDDLICLPPKVASAYGNMNPLVVCLKVSSVIHILDPLTLKIVDIPTANYWKLEFQSIASSKQLLPYVILDIVPTGPSIGKYLMAEATVARECDFGSNDSQFIIRTHLGNILKPGDSALGYDVMNINLSDTAITNLSRRKRDLPDVVLVKKTYPIQRAKAKPRFWKLKTLAKEEADNKRKTDFEKQNQDYEAFLRDIEEDPEIRTNINLYKTLDARQILKQKQDKMDDEEEDAIPEPTLEELLEDLSISDNKPKLNSQNNLNTNQIDINNNNNNVNENNNNNDNDEEDDLMAD
eukprot:TRINITY_DN2372_c1_g1_i1.p1 TRINITY_DN2372_c1_g1~~TRINITY_DN2372_c1_g1_i1.p1  ORF type:complete len:557 (-),score=259.99 TRINITY_DN2372_c1_g1_i1:390-2018(-)